MKQQIDMLLFVVSHAILIYWCVLVFRNPGRKTLGIGLTGRQIGTLLVLEVFLFVAMYISYEANRSPETADSFAWHNLIIYARGVLPLAGLAALNDKVFSLRDPVFATLPTALVVDYMLLWMCSQVADRMLPRKANG